MDNDYTQFGTIGFAYKITFIKIRLKLCKVVLKSLVILAERLLYLCTPILRFPSMSLNASRQSFAFPQCGHNPAWQNRLSVKSSASNLSHISH
jgi:hypothetical protein